MSRRLTASLAWLGIAAAVTLLLWLARDSIDRAHTALVFLMLVLVGSARDGRLTGLILSVACFLAFNFFLLPPYYTLRLSQRPDWWVLITFLVTAGIAAELLHRQRAAAHVAQKRAGEIDRLAALGAESLSVARAGDGVDAIARVIRGELAVAEAEIRLLSGEELGENGSEQRRTSPGVDEDLDIRSAAEKRIIASSRDGTIRVEPPDTSLSSVLARAEDLAMVRVPLAVRQRTVGVLRLTDPAGLRIEPAQASFADALAYYAALAAERVRLSAEAERAEALREADRLKDAMLASLSHDLRTPLTSIRATASELRLEGDERGALIEEEAERLNRQVGDLLDLSRLRAGALPLCLEINAADDLVGAALQRLRGIPAAAQLHVDLASTEVLIGRFDFVHSLRALTNLLENALVHSPDPGSVQLTARLDGDELLFQVLDRGPGVPLRDRDRLFEPFFRSASAAGRQGSGLGLAIASQVAQAQGGSVGYAPRAGGGSVFELRLPAASVELIQEVT